MIDAASARDSEISAAADLPPLVMRFGAFGDMVLLSILLRHLYERFGKPVDVVSSGPWTPPLLEGQPWVGRLFTVRSRRTPYWMSLDQQHLVRWLRERGPGPTWFCDMKLGVDLLNRGGIPNEFIVDSRAYSFFPIENFADRYIKLGNETPTAFAGRLPPPRPGSSRAAQIILSDKARTVADEWLSRHGLARRPYVVVHPGSRHMVRRRRWLRARAGADKYWPEDRWGAVINAVREARPDHAVLVSGTPAELTFNEDIVRASRSADVHNVANDLPINVLLPLLERAQSMISVDTGPAHAAAALGCPTLALFGKQDPTLFRPGGATTPAVTLTGLVDGIQNILGITPESVITAWGDLTRSTQNRAEQSVNSLTCD
jgi:heptosyltransferase-2/heptosyltransferase-3